LLHPSVTTTEGPPWTFLELEDDEKSDHSTRELKFLHPQYLSAEESLDHLHDTRRHVTEPGVIEHYDATEQAVRRLQVAGEAHGWSL
jgi:hypothetical protein